MCLVAERKGPAMKWIFTYSSTTRPAQGMHLEVRRTMSRREELRRQHQANSREKNLHPAG